MTEAIQHLDAEDGHRLTYRVWAPDGAPTATIVLLNGVMSHSGWFFPLVPAFLEAGCRVVGADRRGTGLDEVGRGDAPSASSVVSDAVRIIEAERRPDVPTYLVGWCWGTVLAINVLAKTSVDGLVMVAPGLFPSAAVQDAAKRAEEAAAGRPEDEACVTTPIAETMFTSGPHLEGFIMKDPLRLRAITPRFRALMTKLAIGATARLRRIDVPVLVLLAIGDLATDNDAVRAALARLPEGLVTIREIESAHGMQFDAPGAVASAILDQLPGRMSA